ncbi:putative F-box protein At1g32420 [Silene latifolia]|uniref:putative F-box protein At1g32420 n=1 Tax=Silene latifolia TaxID=37657 RepID=UPI003D78340F
MGDECGGPTSIPQELVSEILCYLPVKSLIRFTIVSKSWLRLIRNNHRFATKNYLTRTTSSSRVLDNADFMFDVQRSNKPCLYAFNEAKTFRFLKNFVCVPDVPIQVSNSCHGIICFYLCLEGEVLLCNPAIEEVLLVPQCPSMYNMTALGFDPINNDYKVVACPYYCNSNYPCRVDVYSLRHGHWRTVQVSDSISDYRLVDVESSSNGRMLIWMAYRDIDKTNAIVSFDMVDNVSKKLPMPKCQLSKTHKHQLLSSTRWQACVSCFPNSQDFNSRFIDVWVLKDWIWRKELAVKFADHEPMRPINFWLNEYELLVAIQKAETEEVFHYDLDTQQLKHTRRKRELGDGSRGYVESLVSIKNLMSLHHERNRKNDDQDIASSQENDGRYILREVRRKGVRLFQSFKLM